MEWGSVTTCHMTSCHDMLGGTTDLWRQCRKAVLSVWCCLMTIGGRLACCHDMMKRGVVSISYVYGLGDFFKLSFIIKWIIILYCVWTTVLVFSLTQTHLELIFKSCVNDCCCILSLTCDWKNISLFSLKKSSFCCCWDFHVKFKRCHLK